MNSGVWRLAVSFALGAMLPWWADLLHGLLAAAGGLPRDWGLPVAWVTAIFATSAALGWLATVRPMPLACAAAAGGLSAMALVVVAHRLPLPWVLALWPQALALGVGLPLATIAMVGARRRR